MCHVAAPASSVNGFIVYPISSHLVKQFVLKICAFVEDVECNSTIAPGCILLSSLPNASSLSAVYPDTSPHRRDSRKTSDIQAAAPSAGSLYYIFPAAGGKISPFPGRWSPDKEWRLGSVLRRRLPAWRFWTYPGATRCGFRRYGLPLPCV